MFPKAVLKTVLLENPDLLFRWRFVVHRAVEMAAALLLLGNALYACLSESMKTVGEKSLHI